MAKATTTLPPVRPGRQPAAAQRFVSVCLACCLLLLLSACKIKIIIPAGGKVVSDNGIECLTGADCVIEVTTEDFDDTFRAVPDPGFVFSHWLKDKSYFCGNVSGECHLFTTTFNGNPALVDFLSKDTVFYLQPVFVSESGYDPAYWATVLAEIDAGEFKGDGFLYRILPNVDQCDPGALTQAARDRVLEALNQTRSLVNLPPVEYDSFYDMQTAEASLVQRANNYLSHFPDPGDNCYSASAADGAATSNITAGPQADPASHIFGWANDNNNVASLMAAGHRRWVVYPQLGYVSYGQVEGSGAQKVFEFGGAPPPTPVSPSVEYVAFPHHTFPYVLVSKGAKPTPWSLSMVPAGGPSSPFNYFASATVSVTNTETGAALPVHSLYSDTQGFGIANFLSWLVDGWDYDTRYTVSIEGISMPGGGVRDIEYDVLLDRFNLVSLDGPLESTDSQQGNRLQGNFNTPEDVDSYTASLAGQHAFTGQSEFSNQGFVIRVYDDRKRLVKSSDAAFSMNFAAGTYTILVSPCDGEGLCYQGTKNYTVTY